MGRRMWHLFRGREERRDNPDPSPQPYPPRKIRLSRPAHYHDTLRPTRTELGRRRRSAAVAVRTHRQRGARGARHLCRSVGIEERSGPVSAEVPGGEGNPCADGRSGSGRFTWAALAKSIRSQLRISRLDSNARPPATCNTGTPALSSAGDNQLNRQ